MSDISDAPEAAPPVTGTPRAPLDDAAVSELAEVFGLLGDPGRMRILVHLRERPHRVGALAAAVGLSPSATSHALRILRLHRIVRVQRIGRHAVYELADEHITQLLDLVRTHLVHSPPDHSLDGLER